MRSEFVKLQKWIIFNCDPSHVNNLGDKDARKVPAGEEKSNFQKVLDVVQWCFHHITYGKNYEDYLDFCEENKFNPRAPLAFSYTRFPQYCY